jgi:hypothetical protein
MSFMLPTGFVQTISMTLHTVTKRNFQLMHFQKYFLSSLVIILCCIGTGGKVCYELYNARLQ